MADNLRQISMVVDTDRFTAKDFAGNTVSSIQVVNGDTVLFAFHFQRLSTAGVLQDLNLSAGGAPLALRFTCRQDRDPDDALLTFQDTYNAGDLASFENLALGQVTWKVSFNDADIDTLLASTDSVDVWIEATYLSAGGIPQTLFQKRLTIVQQLDDGAAGTPPPTSPTYSTAAEIAASYVAKNTFDAYTMLYADTDNTPAALTIAASRIVGRKASGGIAALTGAEVGAIIGISPMSLGGTGADLSAGGAVGDLLIASATPTILKRLAGNTTTTKKYLAQTGTGSASADPAWSQPAFSELSDVPPYATNASKYIRINAATNALEAVAPEAHIADAVTSHTITDPGDAPADADALREDLVTNVIPSIESALNALGTKTNSILTALENFKALLTS
jgi:hypothetical protein